MMRTKKEIREKDIIGAVIRLFAGGEYRKAKISMIAECPRLCGHGRFVP